ncbi:MAG TPA: bifunctional diaminohydroxyphosphoribosylaminopyrimidine deaminase/5-amino-6-(5-phosphoribosylamino)uracil reductase RibD [Acidocella sp.]|jgi:diaminohydroxyphosphoribosylaminopyrimidine deaminase/5-amino-6-(5-phosphoribosylamino)uracil reductase|uniref:bifunctional diaminohydroxyphosphoribosylaminopyrimidine deaminase/5-amino-6-(5-phosphoribosylamino)uracil reductase RibD n=1 Tax=Acidocella sp. TaxID=50710 RepID=UPI002C843554|nr:bifunctional diaminohydroxyphosphoribosylaminopyrimidine deaminase/5-amino-6-(5-phosphoribosylamino)uracil reductase RibD [Acidocella sp.]HVE21127.1 bifunctional diaminohydroxyphosphoribosylaminopyrimidine deaminase/5-amino-6-(5-phosphoribosylamino)uracil reductase RibD [Acidocella sp.]
MSDEAYMRAALALARRGLGETAPNPSVGCVIVRQGRVVGRGRTATGGRPHAEVAALAMAGEQARGATVYVTLEPCNFTGKTGPCTEALIAARVARVVIGATDPHPKVNGAGIQRLRAGGISVTTGVLEKECGAVISGFVMSITQGRPLVRLKLASTLDGRIATSTRESAWLTGEPARRAAHAMRGRHDAVLVGVGTVLADDPELTCRIAGFRKAPLVRIVIDSHLRTPLMSRLVRGAAEHPLWLLHRDGADPARRKALQAAGAKTMEMPASSAGVDLPAAARMLAQEGLTRILCEGGGTLAAGLLRANLVDRLAWFHAPGIIGGDGWPAAQAFGVAKLAAMPRFIPMACERWGDDWLTTYRKAP